MKLSLEQEKERLAQWMSEGAIYDPRNEEDYDTFEYGTEPLPNDSTWVNKKAPDGAIQSAFTAALRCLGVQPRYLLKQSKLWCPEICITCRSGTP